MTRMRVDGRVLDRVGVQISFFDNLLDEIGDEQSLVQSFSMF